MCDRCNENEEAVETRDNRKLCQSCANSLGFCEICGSTKPFPESDRDEQLHFEEECFK